MNCTENQTVSAFYQFYAANLRGSLFTGFLTLTGFLFAIKTFIIINMKKEVYETPEYHKRVADLRGANPNLKIYAPLERLSTLLFWAVVSSLSASVSQLTIGLWPSLWSCIVCLALAFVAIVLLAAALILIRSNLRELFRILEERGLHSNGEQ